ncbi:helix-turn-helix domain-containing protein [Streptomyces sp. NPDC001455]|uniref:ArsR/SmtB family transcription factor n=1 Tax=unclassified Streptomyces TaxID=2593676 RepID=UPI003325752A
MQRIHFTASDLARTRLCGTLGPLAEGALALGALAAPGHAGYARWRAEAHHRLLRRAPSWPSPGRLPRGIAHPDDVLRLLERGSPDDRGTPAGASRAELSRLALDVWRAVVAPDWERIGERLDAECEARGRIAMGGGMERLLATLHPRIVWSGAVLEIPDGPDRDLHLDGRGLLLCPTVFLPGHPGRVVERERGTGMAALVFAVPATGTRAATPWGRPDNHGRALSALVGQTRAAALRALTATCTTGQLAARLGVSSAAASQHTAVLRRSGLITTHRVRNSVLHTVTPLGMALLGGRLRDGATAVSPGPADPPATRGTPAARTAAGPDRLAG